MYIFKVVCCKNIFSTVHFNFSVLLYDLLCLMVHLSLIDVLCLARC